MGVQLRDRAEVRRLLANNLRDAGTMQRLMVFIVLHPFMIAIMAFPVFLRSTGGIGQEFPHLSLFADTLYMAARLVVHMAVMVWAAPWWYLGGLRRNIPFIVVHHGLFVVMSGVSWVVSLTVMDTGLTWHDIGAKALRHQCFAIGLTILFVLFFQDHIKARIGKNPDWVPIWRPVRMPPPTVGLGQLLDPDLGGTLLSLRTQNQYILAQTDQGSKLLRRTLASALEVLPEGAGLMVHRTCWVSSAVLKAGQADKGGTQIEAFGHSYPVGRTRKAVVDAALAKAKPGN